MSFVIFADGTANLPQALLDCVELLPCTYCVDGVQTEYTGDLDSFDAHDYYAQLKDGRKITTSLLNTHLFVSHFRPVLEQGQDVIYVSMSSGISGTYQAAILAKEELEEEFPQRYVHIVDSHGCGFGIGLLVLQAVELSRQGLSAREAGALLDADVPHICQYFTVEDLNFLKRTGRVTGATAAIGTVLNIKPILYGNNDGHIVSSSKVRGKKKAIEALADMYAQKQQGCENRLVAISHGDCPEEAAQLAEKVKAICNPKQLLIVPHEPFSGAHVGPGMLALFFYGSER